MNKFAKLMLACALAAAISTLTACGNKNDTAPQQSQQSQGQTNSTAAQSKPTAQTPAESIAAELADHIVMSKITSANANARRLVDAVIAYIMDCKSYGGNMWESGTIKITVTDGKWTLSGYDVDKYKPERLDHTLAGFFEENFPDITNAYAEIHINEDGRAYGAMYTNTVGAAASEYPPREAFDNREWTWDGKTAGVSPSGIIVGTWPWLSLK